MKRVFQVVTLLLAVSLFLTGCMAFEDRPATAPTEKETEVPAGTQAEGDSMSVFVGTYRDLVPEEADEGYVQITACGDFLLLEHFLCMEGSVYSFWAEEFWPEKSGETDGGFLSLSGMSQTFSMMTGTDQYDTLPRHRVITMTEEGVVLNYDDSDAEYYVKDETFSYHTSKEELRQILGQTAAEEDEAIYGTWSLKKSREAITLTLREDGSVSFLQKKAGAPVQAYEGVFSCAEEGIVNIAAEKIGDGQYPHIMSWQWHVDADGMLWLTFEDERQVILLPTQTQTPRSVAAADALSCVGSLCDETGEYTDQYGTTYEYIYRLPRFYGDDPAAMKVNREIMDKFLPLIKEENGAMVQGEFLSYTEVNWEGNVHEDVLYLHIYAKTWDWEEHSAYYYDVKTGEFLSTQDVLDRLLIDRDYFLEAVREDAKAAFEEMFREIPEEDRQAYGYYDMLEWTVSEEAVNLQLPIYVDSFGSIAVHAKIGSMAGSGIIWQVLRPFDGAVG